MRLSQGNTEDIINTQKCYLFPLVTCEEKNANSRKTSFLSKINVYSKQPGHITQLNDFGESALKRGREENQNKTKPNHQKTTLTISASRLEVKAQTT